jgi:hypothetical protein
LIRSLGLARRVEREIERQRVGDRAGRPRRRDLLERRDLEAINREPVVALPRPIAAALPRDVDLAGAAVRRQREVELRHQRVGGVHVQEAGGADVVDERAEAVLLLALEAAPDLEVEVLDREVAQVEHRLRRRGDADVVAGLAAAVERRQQAEHLLVVLVQLVRLGHLAQQHAAAVDVDLAQHEVVVTEHQRVDVDLGGEPRRLEHQVVLVVPDLDVGDGQRDPAAAHDRAEPRHRPLDRLGLDATAHRAVHHVGDRGGEVGALEAHPQQRDRQPGEQHQAQASGDQPPAQPDRGAGQHAGVG